MRRDLWQPAWKDRLTGNLDKLTLAFTVIAGVSLCSLAVLVFLDVFGRYFLDRPLPFAVELIELLVAIAAVGALPLATLYRSHVAVDLLENVSGPVIRKLLPLVSTAATFVFLGLVCWQLCVRSMVLAESGLVTPILAWPVYPVAVFATVAAGVAALVLLVFPLNPGAQPQPEDDRD